MTMYNNNSPYYKTSDANGYLDVMTFRDIPSQVDDALYEVSSKYQHRPDLLAYDIYNDVGLWWVFAVRNKTVIKDPVYDLKAGVKIYLPKITTIKTALGT